MEEKGGWGTLSGNLGGDRGAREGLGVKRRGHFPLERARLWLQRQVRTRSRTPVTGLV